MTDHHPHLPTHLPTAGDNPPPRPVPEVCCPTRTYSTAEAADLAGLTVGQVRHWRRRRLFTATAPKYRNAYRYTLDEVVQLRAARTLKDRGATTHLILRGFDALHRAGIPTEPDTYAWTVPGIRRIVDWIPAAVDAYLRQLAEAIDEYGVPRFYALTRLRRHLTDPTPEGSPQ